MEIANWKGKLFQNSYTLPKAEILNVKKCAGIGLNSFIFKKKIRIKILKRKENPGSHLGFVF